MEYTNGQRVEVAPGGYWMPATYICKDWTAFGDIYGAHVVLPLHAEPTDYTIVDDDEIRPILTREERIERIIEDYAYLTGRGGWEPHYDFIAAHFAILDAEVPE